jgi:hypothetical protein
VSITPFLHFVLHPRPVHIQGQFRFIAAMHKTVGYFPSLYYMLNNLLTRCESYEYRGNRYLTKGSDVARTQASAFHGSFALPFRRSAGCSRPFALRLRLLAGSSSTARSMRAAAVGAPRRRRHRRSRRSRGAGAGRAWRGGCFWPPLRARGRGSPTRAAPRRRHGSARRRAAGRRRR